MLRVAAERPLERAAGLEPRGRVDRLAGRLAGVRRDRARCERAETRNDERDRSRDASWHPLTSHGSVLPVRTGEPTFIQSNRGLRYNPESVAVERLGLAAG